MISHSFITAFHTTDNYKEHPLNEEYNRQSFSDVHTHQLSHPHPPKTTKGHRNTLQPLIFIREETPH